MANTQIRDALIDHFDRSWTMLRDAINTFPADQWRAGEVDHLIPARHAAHLIECNDFYTGAAPPDQYPWGKILGCDWEDSAAEDLPTQERCLAAIGQIQQKVGDWLGNLTDEALLAPQDAHPWTGCDMLSRSLYMLRHMHHHLGELDTELRRRGLPRPKWR